MRKGNIIKFQILQQTAGGCPTFTIYPPSIANLTVGSVTTINLGATGGTAPYTFSIVSGTLPTGLSLNGSTGVISGTPTTAQNISFVIKATDAEGCTGNKTYTFDVNYEADAQAFITAASITDTTQKNAINKLVVDLKGYGIWNKMKAIYPFVGGTASTHKWNLKDPRDLDAAFRLVFSGGITHTSNGVDPNGVNGLADTKMTSASLGISSFAMWYYSRENITTSTLFGNANKLLWQPKMSNGYRYSALNSNVDLNNTAGDFPSSFAGFLGINTLSSTNSKLYRNGVSYRTLPTLLGRGTESGNITLFYRNLIGQPTSNECALSAITDGLTDTEASNLYTAVQAFQTTLGRSIGTQTVSDADAQAFVTAANIQDQVQADAVNNLTIGLKADGLWSKMKAIYPFVGGDAASHKFNLKNPLDTDAAFRLVFNGGWTHSATGADANGSNGYGDTKFNPFANLTNTSFHHSVYLRDSMTSSTSIGVVTNSFANRTDFVTIGSTLYNSIGSAGALQNSTTSTPFNGLILGSRISSTSNKLYTKGILRDTKTGANSAALPNDNYWLAYGKNMSLSYGNNEYAFASIGDGLTDTEAANLYTLVQTYQTALNRQV